MTRFLLAACVIWSCSPQVGAEQPRSDVESAVAQIDRLLQQNWDRNDVVAAASSGDAEFHRRAWLDLAGVAPPVAEVRQFLADPETSKRDRLIDRLLDSPLHAGHLATRWTEILLPPDSANQIQQQTNVDALHQWLRNQFLQNRPYDHLVGEFLTAGGAGNRGPAIFYTSRDLTPKTIAAATAKIFLGLQLQCAECHDHPFDRWTQEDFWQYTAFFSQLQPSTLGPSQTIMIEDRVGGEVTIPETDIVARPMYPGVVRPPDQDPTGMRRRQLTIWMASRDNPYFIKAAVNRVWHHLFGRGLVEPVDAMDEANQPSHPELLNFLSDYFVRIRFDLRRLYATLARTRVYQLSSQIDSPRPEDSFAAMAVKTLTAAQFYDSLQQNVLRNHSAGLQDPARTQFLSRMQAPDASPRDYPHGVVQVLGIMNGPEVAAATDVNRIGLLAALEAPFFDDQQRIETLFLATLSRFPTPTEADQFLSVISESKVDRSVALADLLWVLLNTAEFSVSP